MDFSFVFIVLVFFLKQNIFIAIVKLPHGGCPDIHKVIFWHRSVHCLTYRVHVGSIFTDPILEDAEGNISTPDCHSVRGAGAGSGCLLTPFTPQITPPHPIPSLPLICFTINCYIEKLFFFQNNYVFCVFFSSCVFLYDCVGPFTVQHKLSTTHEVESPIGQWLI